MKLDKRINIKNVILLFGSLIIDSVQGFVLFNAALCSIPFITGVSAVLTFICSLAFLGISTLGAVFSILWGLFAYWVTKKKLMIGAGFLEAVPIVNALPVFTLSSIYFIYKQR